MEINNLIVWEDSETPRSPVYHFGKRDAQVTRSFQIRPGDDTGVDEQVRMSLAENILGYSVLTEGGGARYIERQVPYAHHCGASARNEARVRYQYAVDLKLEPISGRTLESTDDDTPAYAAYRGRVTFETLPYFVLEDGEVQAPSGPLVGVPDEGFWIAQGWVYSRYISRQIDYAPRTVTLPQGMAKFIKDDSFDPEAKASPVPVGIPYSQFRTIREYTWHEVPIQAIPEQAIELCAQAVNLEEFDGCEPGTLLLLGAKISHYPSPLGGGMLADVSYKMCHLPNIDPATGAQIGWNGIIRGFRGNLYVWPLSLDGEEPVEGEDGNDERLFKLRDFADLFRPDQT